MMGKITLLIKNNFLWNKLIIVLSKLKKIVLNISQSQETKKDKFKNKNKMIKSFLIPISFWISKRS